MSPGAPSLGSDSKVKKDEGFVLTSFPVKFLFYGEIESNENNLVSSPVGKSERNCELETLLMLNRAPAMKQSGQKDGHSVWSLSL